MSGKRQATSDLNHDNWDKDEEPEERGTFRQATNDELKNRVIKKAKRKIAGSSGDSGDGPTANKSVFSGFSGFGQSAPSQTAASPFSFLSKMPTASVSSSSSSVTSGAAAKPTFSFGSAAAAATTTTAATAAATTTGSKTTATATKTTGSNASSSYSAKVTALNQAVSDWIKTHVDKNPRCILTPIFKDYEKYLREIDDNEADLKASDRDAQIESPKKDPAASTSSASTFGAFKFSATTSLAPPATTSTFSFGSVASSSSAASTSTTATTKTTTIFGNVAKAAVAEAPKTNGFSFGLKADDKATGTAPPASSSFSFGKPAGGDDNKPSGFSFTTGAKPFSFGNIQPPAASAAAPAAKNPEDEEDDEPPKVEFKQVVEDDAVFSKKCKVFVKKDGNFADRGVGTVYLKPVQDTEKTQLLVRADTNLGNILVNLILNASIPAQRMGKNNVMLVCLPTPDMDKPTSMLLRVKTGEEADELLAAIEKYKK